MKAIMGSGARLRPGDILVLGLAMLPALVLGGYGHVAMGVEILDKGAPDFSFFGQAKMFTAFVAAAILVLVGNRIRGQQTVEASIAARSAIICSIAFLAACMAAVILVPRSLNHFVRELQPLSIMTEVVLVAALVMLALAMRAAHREGTGRLLGVGGGLIHAVLLGAVFLILMEEASWGQHWFGFGTPGLFEGNVQNETNLHNFYTYRFELIYYSMAVIAFVLLPAFWPTHLPQVLQPFSHYVPPAWFALFALPVCGLMYESWNILPYQLWFFSGALTAIVLSRRNDALRSAGLLQMAMLAVSQIVFVMLGHRMEDGYELSEVREFFIAALIAAYALVTWKRAAKSQGSSSSI